MDNLLENLWAGKIHPREQCIHSTPEKQELLVLMERTRKRLGDILSEEEKEILESYIDYMYELQSHTEREIFIYAFRLGGKMMLETLKGDKKSTS